MLDIEGEACFFAAEQGETLHASLRFVRDYMKYRKENGTPHAGGLSVSDFYGMHRNFRIAFAAAGVVPLCVVRSTPSDENIVLGEN